MLTKSNIYSKEMRVRSLYILFASILTFSSSYFFAEQIFHILALPLAWDLSGPLGTSEFHFIFTELTEGFWTYAKISVFVSVYLSLPLISYQAWSFFKPGLYLHEKWWFQTSFFVCVFLCILNTILIYFLILPAACKFFLSYEIASPIGTRISAGARIYTYTSFISNLLFWCNIVLQLPNLVLAGIRLGLISEIIVTKKRKLCYFLSMVLSALIAPPDLLSLIIMTILIAFSYELTVIFLVFLRCFAFPVTHKETKENDTHIST